MNDTTKPRKPRKTSTAKTPVAELVGKVTVDPGQGFETDLAALGLKKNPAIGPLNDFRNFAYLVWQHINLPAPTDVQFDICNYLQHGPKRSIVMAFRGVGKSYLTAAYVVWLWLIDPQLKILVVSASQSKALDFATLVKNLLFMDVCAHLQPGKDQRSATQAFDVGPATAAKDPSLRCLGIEGQLVGGRADIIIADDVETPTNSQTTMQREKLGNLVKEFDSILKPDVHSRIIYLGTPQTENSLYMTLGSERGYDIKIWPARFPADVGKYEGRLAPMINDQIIENPDIVGKTTDPKRFSDENLAERELSQGKTYFQLQYMLDPSLSDFEKFPLKLKDFIVFPVNPDACPAMLAWAEDPRNAINSLPCVGMSGDAWYGPMYVAETWEPFNKKVMVIDPAGGGKDRTAYVIGYVYKGYVHVPEFKGLEGGYSTETLDKLAIIARDHKVNQVVIEKNFGNGMYTELLKPILHAKHKCDVIEITSKGRKEMRICDAAEPVMQSHRIVIDPKVVRTDLSNTREHQAFYQITRMTRTSGALKHDDLVDVFGMMLDFLKEDLGFNTQMNEEQIKQQLHDEMMDAYFQKVFGKQNSQATWLTLKPASRSHGHGAEVFDRELTFREIMQLKMARLKDYEPPQ